VKYYSISSDSSWNNRYEMLQDQNGNYFLREIKKKHLEQEESDLLKPLD
jgi:hypothetical protein